MTPATFLPWWQCSAMILKGTYTDCLRRAAWRRWPSEADKVAQAAVGPGFQMVAESVATILGDIP